MNKNDILLICILLLTGCQLGNNEKYVEKSKKYEIGEEKVVVEYQPAKEAYSETVLSGSTTSWGLQSRYEVGYGKDIEPGTYDIVSSGWADYNIFVGGLKLKFNWGFTSYLFIDPLSQSVCYAKEQSCMFTDTHACYSRIEDITLSEGTIIYTEQDFYGSHQSVSIRFEAQYVTIEHPKEEEVPEVKVTPIEVKESIRKYSSGYKCYINDYEVPDCKALKYYDEIKKKFK